MAGYWNDEGQFVFEDEAQAAANACPTDPLEALLCDGCQ